MSWYIKWGRNFRLSLFGRRKHLPGFGWVEMEMFSGSDTADLVLCRAGAVPISRYESFAYFMSLFKDETGHGEPSSSSSSSII